ncbi:MAG: 50S ribosomal protein L6, partial [Thermodesulfobacteria bacterium]|nr:50S ribosomal protein L6 [Thermodesulfobacteriota bacterium]
MLSRIGRRPVPIPQGVKVEIRDGIIAVQGPKGKLEKAIPPLVEVKVEENEIRVLPAQTQKRLAKKVKAFHGLARALINNLVVGVTQGFTRSLDIVGLGYRAELKGNTLVLNVGYS